MRNTFFSILTICFCFASQAYSENYLTDFFEGIQDKSLEKVAVPTGKKVQNKYQATTFASSKGFTETALVTYETLPNGVRVHIGWYTDGFIMTALDGTETGKQVIFINGSVVGVSYDIKFYNSYFSHDYTWAKVISFSNRQILKTK